MANTVPTECIYTVGTVFRENSQIVKFNELKIFTLVKHIDVYSFQSCSKLEEMDFTNITSLGGSSFRGTKIQYAWLPKLTAHSGTSGAAAPFYYCSSLVAVRFDAITSIGSFTTNSSARYAVITTSSVPTMTIANRIPKVVYVLDSLVSSYLADANWSKHTIRRISDLPTNEPACPWLDDLRTKGFIS